MTTTNDQSHDAAKEPELVAYPDCFILDQSKPARRYRVMAARAAYRDRFDDLAFKALIDSPDNSTR